jgi:hypothetical protein
VANKPIAFAKTERANITDTSEFGSKTLQLACVGRLRPTGG